MLWFKVRVDLHIEYTLLYVEHDHNHENQLGVS